MLRSLGILAPRGWTRRENIDATLRELLIHYLFTETGERGARFVGCRGYTLHCHFFVDFSFIRPRTGAESVERCVCTFARMARLVPPAMTFKGPVGPRS